MSGGGRGIERVDVSVDGGKTWLEASRYQKAGISYIADDEARSDKWAWVFFETEADILGNAEIVAKAVRLLLLPTLENWQYRFLLVTLIFSMKIVLSISIYKQ